MKIIKNLFILGLVNLILMLGIFTAAGIVTSPKMFESIPIDKLPSEIPNVIDSPKPDAQVNQISVTPSAKPTAEPTLKPTAVVTQSPTPTAVATQVPTPTAVATQAPTPTAVATQAPTPTTDPLAGKCIIYISGQRYDVTEFRNLHSGGDIFQCGTDMTDIFNGQHPSSYLSKIAKYKI